LAFFLRRKAAIIYWSIVREKQIGLDFTMLCIVRPVYVPLAIDSINSLHLWNPSHRVNLFLDDACYHAFQKLHKELDYPGKVFPMQLKVEANTPWQITKLHVVLKAARDGSIYVDADTSWQADPVPYIPKDKVMFLTKNFCFRDMHREKLLLEEALMHSDWTDLFHYNITLVSIPSSKVSQTLTDFCTSLANQIYYHSSIRGMPDEDTQSLRRLCEEITLSVAAQQVIGESIATLYEQRGRRGQLILESSYYGALHDVK
jgi:hypothetical protein